VRASFDPVTLRLFVAVCEEQNIARAAEREAIVPSAISKRIAALESQVGVALLLRGRRGLNPTPAGEVLLRQARDVLSTMDRMQAELGEFARGVHGNIRIFASLSALSEFLPDDVSSFLARHEAVRVTLDERVSSEVMRGVREGVADFGVCWDASDLGGLETVNYRTDHLCAVVPAGHALGRLEKIAFVDTLRFDQIDIRAGSIVQSTLRRAAAQSGQTPRYRIQVSNFEAACRSIAAGLGIAIMPREAIGEAHAGALALRLVPLTDRWAARKFVMCLRSRDTLTQAAGMLVDYLHERAIHHS
jgi:DNA-binding transcriptional LysR family regulator